MTGSTLGEKIWGALRRTVTGESLFVTYFRSNGAGEVGFAGNYPGRVQAFDLQPGQEVICQRDGFICAQPTVQLKVALVKKLGAGLFGGEGFILERFTGPGTVFIHGGGDFVEFTLQAGEVLQVDTGCIVAFQPSVNYDIQYVGKIQSALFGGEGLFFATLRGRRVWLQSLPPSFGKPHRLQCRGCVAADARKDLSWMPGDADGDTEKRTDQRFWCSGSRFRSAPAAALRTAIHVAAKLSKWFCFINSLQQMPR
jgi:uncharacterized protein (AIM24 family)